MKPADLPDFTIKEVKVYVVDLTNFHKLNSSETGEIVSIVTHDGIEGNYTLGNRSRTENWLDVGKTQPHWKERPGAAANSDRDLRNEKPRRVWRPAATPGTPGHGAGRHFDKTPGSAELGNPPSTSVRAAAERGPITTPLRPISASGIFWEKP